MINYGFPNNLDGLNRKEQSLRQEAMGIIQNDHKLLLHLNAVERVMTLSKVIVDFPTEDEDFRVIKMLSIRMFNAFAASLELMLTGYHQNSALVMRDILETLFLIDFFKTDYQQIERWRFADKKEQREVFSPAAVRKALDKRDGLNTQKRAEIYKMFSELAAHPNMHSQHMLKPEKGGDIMMGPFMEGTSLKAGISEIGKLAAQTGEILDSFLPIHWDPDSVRTSFTKIKNEWMKNFTNKSKIS